MTQHDGITHVNLKTLIGLQALGRMRRATKTAIKSPLQGGYRSKFKARGMEFSESREYQPGDDVRAIDWRVTARTGKTHTKLFEEERERPVFCLVDYRQSMFFATQGRLKSVLAAEVAALIGWRAHFAGDKIGGIIFSDTVHTETKPARGQAAVLHWIHQLSKHAAWEDNHPTDHSEDALTAALVRLRKVALPGSLIYILSDFRLLTAQAEKQLTLLSQHNHLVLTHLYDPFEQTLPQKGHYPIEYAGQTAVIHASQSRYRKNYTAKFSDKMTSLSQLSIKLGGQFNSLDTTSAIEEIL